MPLVGQGSEVRRLGMLWHGNRLGSHEVDKKARVDLERRPDLREQGRRGMAQMHSRPPPAIPEQRGGRM